MENMHDAYKNMQKYAAQTMQSLICKHIVIYLQLYVLYDDMCIVQSKIYAQIYN